MNDHRKRILDMLEEGTITADEAMMLLDQTSDSEPASAPPPVYAPAKMRDSEERMLRVRVHVVESDNPNPVVVNVNLPLKAAKIAGKMMNTMMPEQARDAMSKEGINLSGDDIVELVEALAETGGDIVNVQQQDTGNQVSVRVYVE